MQICGLNKTTLLDYPEHVAATIFAGGCNFRCPFCHNGDLVLNSQSVPAVSMEELNSFLKNAPLYSPGSAVPAENRPYTTICLHSLKI